MKNCTLKIDRLLISWLMLEDIQVDKDRLIE
nr:MAG TPA: hypothetical protein [Caudoviricetes sp.]